MPSSERIKLQGRKAELEEKIRELDTRAQNHIITIRDLVDPYEEFIGLEVERAEQAMISLKVLVTEAREKAAQLRRIKRELGNE